MLLNLDLLYILPIFSGILAMVSFIALYNLKLMSSTFNFNITKCLWVGVITTLIGLIQYYYSSSDISLLKLHSEFIVGVTILIKTLIAPMDMAGGYTSIRLCMNTSEDQTSGGGTSNTSGGQTSGGGANNINPNPFKMRMGKLLYLRSKKRRTESKEEKKSLNSEIAKILQMQLENTDEQLEEYRQEKMKIKNMAAKLGIKSASGDPSQVIRRIKLRKEQQLLDDEAKAELKESNRLKRKHYRDLEKNKKLEESEQKVREQQMTEQEKIEQDKATEVWEQNWREQQKKEQEDKEYNDLLKKYTNIEDD